MNALGDVGLSATVGATIAFSTAGLALVGCQTVGVPEVDSVVIHRDGGYWETHPMGDQPTGGVHTYRV